jgi:hypothetical protein
LKKLVFEQFLKFLKSENFKKKILIRKIVGLKNKKNDNFHIINQMEKILRKSLKKPEHWVFQNG